jgi:hypothetical protein
MATIRTSRLPLEKIEELLRAGFSLNLISQESGYPPSVLSIFAKAWKIPPRKRGPKPGTKGIQ